jgi:hypothetical protein
VDFFFRHYHSCCHMFERGRIHDAASETSRMNRNTVAPTARKRKSQ